MNKDNDDLFEKIRKINERDDLLAGITTQDDSPSEKPPKTASEHLESYLAGLLLLLWTISPVLIGFIAPDLMLSMFLCFYPIISPFIWFQLGRWKPDAIAQTMVLDLLGHVLLFFGIFWVVSENSGSSYYFAYDMIAVLIILALLILSAIGSVFILLFGVGRSQAQEPSSVSSRKRA